MLMKKASHSWWFDSHNSPKRSSPWLQSTLSELDEKTKAMLKLIEEDADSFAQRAEMYYKKRPELINMVEDFYRTHRSLAERFDQLKLDSWTRLTTPSGPLFSNIYQRSHSLKSPMEISYCSYSEKCDSEVSGESEVDEPEQDEETQIESEVDDPEQDEETQVDSEVDDPEQEVESQDGSDTGEEKEASSGVNYSEVMKLRDEIERLKEENRIQKEQLMEKDEEKREAIRQLCLALENSKEENVNLKKCITKVQQTKKHSPFEFNKLKGVILGMLFSGSSKSRTSLVVLKKMV